MSFTPLELPVNTFLSFSDYLFKYSLSITISHNSLFYYYYYYYFYYYFTFKNEKKNNEGINKKGDPKGLVRDTAGYAVALNWSMKNIFDIKGGDTFWAASDVGWVVGHSYIVYGSLPLNQYHLN